MMPQILETKLVGKTNLAGSYWSFVLEFVNDFDFVAGQYVSVKVAPDGSRRSYSIASVPNGNRIELLIDVAPMGLGSKFFLGLNVGENIEILGPMGRFMIQESNNQRNQETKLLFVATGSGIVPFRSMILDQLKNKDYKGQIHLHWGMRHEEDLFWIDEFRKLEEKYPNFKLKLILSKPSVDWGGKSGHVQESVIEEKIDYADWEAYLCGSQQMITEMGPVLMKTGMKMENIHYEKFF